VEGNPLTDLRRLRRFDGRVHRGAWIPASRWHANTAISGVPAASYVRSWYSHLC